MFPKHSAMEKQVLLNFTKLAWFFLWEVELMMLREKLPIVRFGHMTQTKMTSRVTQIEIEKKLLRTNGGWT